MHPRAAIFLTVIFLVCLQVAFPMLLEHWVITIGKALPSFFTLGVSTVLLYKALRYPRGTAFTFFGLVQIAFSSLLVWKFFQLDLAWISLLIILGAIVFGPKSARTTWRWFGVDRYYNNNSEN